MEPIKLTRENFKFSSPGQYDFEGQQITITEKITGYGTGKKTVYTGTAYKDGAGYYIGRKDITVWKRFYNIAAEGAKKAPKKAQEPKPAPVPAEKPTTAPAPAETPAKKAEVVKHAQYDNILNMLKLGMAPYLYGPAGSGKNVICEQLANDLGVTFYYSNSVTQEYKIEGYSDAAGVYHDTEFFNAWTKGGLFMLDELDASIPEVLTLLNAALANGYFVFAGKRVYKHENTYIIAAGNTCGKGATELYTGRYCLDAASLNRFKPTPFEYDPRIEESICKGDTDILDFVRSLRKAAEKIGYNCVLGYRNIRDIYKMKMAGNFTVNFIVEVNVRCGAGVDTITALKENYTGRRDNPYFVAL